MEAHTYRFLSVLSLLCKQILLKVHNSHRIRIIFTITKATSSLSSVALTECQSCLKHTGALLQSGRNMHAPSQTIRHFQLITTHAEAHFCFINPKAVIFDVFYEVWQDLKPLQFQLTLKYQRVAGHGFRVRPNSALTWLHSIY